jgi:hypothetical protein
LLLINIESQPHERRKDDTMALSLGAGLAWAVPVRPNELLISLIKFDKVLPTIQALRLCHRFWQGPNVHIGKLPVELVLQIEEFLSQSAYISSDWAINEDFACYECRCSPFPHGGAEENTPLIESVQEEIGECKACRGFLLDDESDRGNEYSSDESQKYGFERYQGKCSKRCTEKAEQSCYACKDAPNLAECVRTCKALINEELNEAAFNEVFWYENHWQSIENWEKRINQRPGGMFDKYDKVRTPALIPHILLLLTLWQLLLKHFGLQVIFNQTRINDMNRLAWPKDKRYLWHDDNDMRTTLCFLALPKSKLSNGRYESSQMEADMDGADMQSGQAHQIDLQELASGSESSPRFLHALRVLDLKPYVHPSTGISGGDHLDAEKGDGGCPKKSSKQVPSRLCPINIY